MTRKTFWLRVATFLENRGVELHELGAALEERGHRTINLARRLNRRVNPPPPPVPVDLAKMSQLIRETWNTGSVHRRYVEAWDAFLSKAAPIEWVPVPDLFTRPARDYSNVRGGADGRPESRFMHDEYYLAQPLTIIDDGWSPWTPVQGAT